MQSQVPIKKDLRAEAASQVEKRRKMLRYAICLGAGAVAVFPGILLEPTRAICGIAFLVGIFWAVIGYALTRMRCPGCKRMQGEDLGKFCPWCGADSLHEEGMVFKKKTCTSCQKVYRKGKNGYSYKTRYCTFCGSFLAEESV